MQGKLVLPGCKRCTSGSMSNSRIHSTPSSSHTANHLQTLHFSPRPPHPPPSPMSAMSPRWRRGLLFLAPPLLFLLTLLLSVMDLHRISTLERARQRRSMKHDHLVLGPAAGQGLPDRIQCDGHRALNRTHLSDSAQYSKNSSVSFVSVYTFYNVTPTPGLVAADRVTIGNVSYDRNTRAMAILDAFISFIQVSMPNSNIIILSDPESTFSVRKKNVEMLPIQGDYSREKLMLQRIRTYKKFLEQKLEQHLQNQKPLNHYIFTDSDIAVVDNLQDVFEDYPHFHIALTFRNNKEQPLNSGFIAVRGTTEGISKAIVFLQGVLDVYVSRYMKSSRMLGDQLALAWVVKSQNQFDSRKFGKPAIFSEEIGGATVLFLPCLIYNWTPPEGAGQLHGMPLNVKVVHFKGSRKRLMLEAWSFFNSASSNLSDMLCLVLASGRTKYDF